MIPLESGGVLQLDAANPCEGGCGGSIGADYGMCLRGDCFFIYCQRCWDSHKREVHDVADDMEKLMNWRMGAAAWNSRSDG